MTKKIILVAILINLNFAYAQTNPVIISWLQNTTGIKGRHYVTGNSTPIQDNDSANVQTVLYSGTWSYIRTKGVPAYITGPFLDGNPSTTTSQNAIFKFPLNPTRNTGTATPTSGGNIGIFINGVALFDYRDGVSWKNSTNSICGGPVMPPCMGDGVWNRDAIVAEKGGFDCSKGHPAMGNYHHHQNPSAFNLDLSVISTVCNLYTADALYRIDSTVHSPLIGFAYDGFPIYGAYGYRNIDGTGGIVRMKSSYSLRNITTRTTYSNGNTVTAGPPVSSTYPLGYFREDYQYNATSTSTPDYLDDHNGRFCVTPEYPNGIYCYFATVNANWNSAYPYVVGPTFYGNKTAAKVTSINETVTRYIPGTTVTPTVTALNCSNSQTTAGTVNTTYSGTGILSYTGGNGVAYTSGASINSSGVTGLTATLQAGTLATGNGNLVYNISGTPTSAGTATFPISFGGQTCSFSVTINNVIPTNPSVTTLNCTNVQTTTGTVNTSYSGTATVSYTGGNGVAYTSGASIASSGVIGLTATLQGGILATGNGNVVYNIFGTPTSAGIATFPISFGGQTCSFSVTINNVIPTNPSVTTLNCTNVQTTTGTVNTSYSGIATVSYTGGNGVAYSSSASINSSGVTGLTATLQGGTLATGNGNFVYNISGTPNATGTASFVIIFSGQTCTFNINVDAVGTSNNDYPFDFIVQPPHPQKDNLKLTILPSSSKVKNVFIYDASGRIVYSSSNPNLSNSINISNLSNGVYMIKLIETSTNKIQTKKFIKE